MPLQEEIDKTRLEIRTDSYSMSIGEWISLYESKEIDIHPDFQRFFRWSDWLSRWGILFPAPLS